MSKTRSALKKTPNLSLRERNKIDKRDRIIRSASRLFAEKGYSKVTTNAIAQAADVGNGTLFRYVRSKADLLVAVMNDLVLEGIHDGLADATEHGDPVNAILTVLRPLSRKSLTFPENIIEYEKEALFGNKSHKTEVTTRIADVEKTILEILHITGITPRDPRVPLDFVATTIYSTVYMDIIKASVGNADVATLPQQVKKTIENLITAFCND